MTHQEIVDRIEALGREHSKAYEAERARIDAERKSLQQQCGGLGHVYGANHAARLFPGEWKCCVFCGADEPKAPA